MSAIVIVEDMPGRGMTLAQQIEEMANDNPGLGLHVMAICCFGRNENEIMSKVDCARQDLGWVDNIRVRPVTLWNFDEVMDEYMEDDETIFIMDYALQGDGSGGIPYSRVNIRYASYLPEEKKRRVWFYTATGIENYKILCKLFGEQQVFEIDNVHGEHLRLHLDKPEFQHALSVNVPGGV